MWLERISGGGQSLMSLADAKKYLKILTDETDDEVTAAIAAASSFLDVDEDGFGGLGFPQLAQQWTSKGPAFNAQVLRLPFVRIASVDAIEYLDADGAPGTVDSGFYQLVKDGRSWRIFLKDGETWPDVDTRPDAVTVTFTAGWPDLAAVPIDIINASKVLMRYFFDYRDAAATGEVSEDLMQAIDRVTSRYRRWAH